MAYDIFWGGSLRILQALLQAAPTILVGLLVAAVFRRLLGTGNVKRLFGAGTRRSLLHAWGLGMLLPVCSLGVIPIVREMRRAGISSGTILAFAVTAPLFNPLSLLYGLTLSEPFTVLAFAFCSLVVVTVVGMAWERFVPDPLPYEACLEKPVTAGLPRMLAIGVHTAREMTSSSLGYMALGLLGVGALVTFLPAGAMQTAAEHRDPLAPVVMTAMAIPAYATPMQAMGQLGSMFQHGNSVGAAFCLLVLGAGLNLGLVALLARSYGLACGLGGVGALVTVVLVLSYAIEGPLYPSAIDPAGHTHAFDGYCRPFRDGMSDLPQQVAQKVREEAVATDAWALAILGGILVTGLVLKVVDRTRPIEEWLEGYATPTSAAWHNLNVPAPVLGGVALLGLVIFSIVGCYTYYPPTGQAFQEMRRVETEAVLAGMHGDVKQVEYYVPQLEDVSRRMQVGHFLRGGRLSEYHRMKAKVFRDKLEILEHTVAEGEKQESYEAAKAVRLAYERMRRAYIDN